MEDILHPNYQALSAFARDVIRDLAPGNKHVKVVNCLVNYHWNNQHKTVETLATIRLNAEPYANIELTAKDWLNAKDHYLMSQTRYNDFTFDPVTGILTIKCNQASKMGDSYLVNFKEIPHGF